MSEPIAIPGTENKAGAELEGVLAEPVFAVTRGPRAASCFGIVAAEDVEQVSRS